MTQTAEKLFRHEPGDILPVQLLQPSTVQLEPVKRLMLAVLDRAVNDFRTYAAVPTARGRRLFTDIEAWFGSSTTDAFDFETICQAIGFDPDYIRNGLRASYDRSRQLPIGAASEPKIAAPSVRHVRSCERCRRRHAGVRALDASTRGMRQVAQ